MPRPIPRRFVVVNRCKIGNTRYQPGDAVTEVFDRPFDRLLWQGHLRLADEAEAPVSAPASTPEPESEQEPVEHVDLDLHTMTKNELLATAELLGVKASKKMNKADIIAAIEA